MKKIVIHYPFVAQYRMPIFTLLSMSDKYKFEFWAGDEGSDRYLLTSTKNLNVKKTPFKTLSFPGIRKMFEWQPSAIIYMLREKMDAYIVLGNPNSLSTWLCVLIARLRSIPVLMWSHGYLKDEKGLKGLVRKTFYKLANTHLLYGNKAKDIMKKKGFNAKKLHVIYNSLDYEKQKAFRDSLSYEDRKETRLQYGFQEESIVLIAIGRLMKKLKLEQVLEAIKMQTVAGHDVRLFLVGDGPEYNYLKELADKYTIQDKVVFYGACHEEQKLAKLYNASDYSVVMGKVGLAAMHSLAYGIPMITNNNLDEHFPEIEAITEGKTGFYFQEDDINSFIEKIKPIPYRDILYKQCIKVIEKNYTPNRQKELIEKAIDGAIRKSFENRFLKCIRNVKYAPLHLKYFLLGYKFGKNFVVGKKVNIEKIGFSAGDNVYVGQYSYIGPNTKIGNFCMLSDNVNVVGHDHNFEHVGVPIIFAGRPAEEPNTVFQDDVWIGHGVTIMRGVTIGEGSIVGANSVVTKDIPPYCIYAGIPAKFIRKRFATEKERRTHSYIIKKNY